MIAQFNTDREAVETRMAEGIQRKTTGFTPVEVKQATQKAVELATRETFQAAPQMAERLKIAGINRD